MNGVAFYGLVPAQSSFAGVVFVDAVFVAGDGGQAFLVDPVVAEFFDFGVVF